MRKPAVLLLVFGLSLSFTAQAQAADKTTVLTKAFQKYLTDGELAYVKAMGDAKALYEPRISIAQNKLSGALTQFSQVNQVTILKTTTHSPSAPIGIDAVNCPISRTDCKDPTYKSNEFKSGEVGTVYNFIGGDASFSSSSWAQMNLGILQTIDLEVKDGLISLNNATAYNSATSTIRTQYQTILSLNQQYASAQSSAASDREYVQSMQPVIATAILSAKRAKANSSAFDKAFVVSLKFEYNAKRLDELASAPWTYITSLKALNNAVSVTKSSMQADAVSSHYSYSAAGNINAIYGNLFVNEPEFKNNFKLISDIYKASTGVTLSLK
jgi:hypothetical protein